MITEKKNEIIENIQQPVDRVDLTFYTDPLCCWSWAMYSSLKGLQELYPGTLSVRYCMGGMIPDWTSYDDAVNAVSKPIQMGPVWMEAQHLTGVQLNSRIWFEDPPASSYPGCIAVKCAQLQSDTAGEEYLRLLWQAVMENGRNIAKMDELVEISNLVTTEFDTGRFSDDLINGNGKSAFSKDLDEVRKQNISRFPTLVMKSSRKGLIFTGYRALEVLLEGVRSVV